MQFLFSLFIFLGACALGAWYGLTLKKKIAVSDALVARTRLFEKEGGGEGATLLVLGDSTAVGVGANVPEESVAGKLAEVLRATLVENRARSGAVTADLAEQAMHAKLPKYSCILIAIGGNDIIRFRRTSSAVNRLEYALKKLPKTDRLIVHSAGNVGAATFFPWFIRPFHTTLNLKYHTAFADVVEKHGGIYVNLYESPERDPFVRRPEVYLAPDGLHPSSAGYALWFQKIQTVLE